MRISPCLALFVLAVAPVVGRADDKPAVPKGVTAEKKAAAETKPGPLTEIPARLTLKQRTTTVVPGSDGKLQVTVDDITRGQVITSVSHSKHGVLVGPTSMRVGDAKKFELESTTYQIRLKALNNALIGDDFGEFVVGYPTKSLTEPEKIDRLIQVVAELPKEVVFVRNGKERTAESEAEFLRKRGEAWKGKDLTATAFIERLCAKSTSDKPYQVRVAGHPALPMEYYLREKLREIEAGD